MTAFKGFIGGKDFKHWDGVTRNFSRRTSTGGTLTQNKIGQMVDVLEAFGDGENYTLAAITAATGAIGTSNVTMMLQTGTWTITDDLTIAQTIRLWTEKGVTIDVSSGKTLTLNCTLPTLKNITFTGSGTVVTAPVDQIMTATGNVNLGANAVQFDSTAGAFTATLRDGVLGQRISVELGTDGGDVTFTVSNHADGAPTSFTFDDAGDFMQLVWDGTIWRTLLDTQNPNIFTKGADIASATTITIPVVGDYFDITGSTGPIGTITVVANREFVLQFDSTPTLTHHATNLDLPGEADIIARAGDSLRGFSTATNQVHVTSYTRADGTPVIDEIEGATIADSGTPDIFNNADGGKTVHLAGTTTITDFPDSPSVGRWRKIIFDGIRTLTHGSGITLPGSANITTAAGDYAFVYADTVSAFTALYFRANGKAVIETASIANVVEDTTPQTGGFFDVLHSINEAEGANITDSGTPDIFNNTDGSTVHLEGTTTITDFPDAPKAGIWRRVIFDGIRTLTHGSGITLPGSANITTAVGDIAFVYADTVSAFTVLYFRADGTAIGGGGVEPNELKVTHNSDVSTVAATDETVYSLSGAGIVTGINIESASAVRVVLAKLTITVDGGTPYSIDISNSTAGLPQGSGGNDDMPFNGSGGTSQQAITIPVYMVFATSMLIEGQNDTDTLSIGMSVAVNETI